MRQPRWIAERWKDGRRMGWCSHLHRYPDTAARCARLAFPRGPEWGEWSVRKLGGTESPWQEPFAFAENPYDVLAATVRLRDP